MNISKPPLQQAAFTLVELVIVIAVLAILAIYIQSRPSGSGAYRQDAAIEQIIAAARLTQQLSVNDSARSFVLEVQEHGVSLLVDPARTTFNGGALEFPITFGDRISLSPIGDITFDRSGTPSSDKINVNGSSHDVCLESSGYIHRC